MKSRWIVIIVMVCIIIIGIIIIPQQNRTTAKLKRTKSINDEREELHPFRGEKKIKVNLVANLKSLSEDELFQFRLLKIKDYEELNIFPSNYDIRKYPSRKIFSSIEYGVDWMNDAQFYIANPYLFHN